MSRLINVRLIGKDLFSGFIDRLSQTPKQAAGPKWGWTIAGLSAVIVVLSVLYGVYLNQKIKYASDQDKLNRINSIKNLTVFVLLAVTAAVFILVFLLTAYRIRLVLTPT